MNHVTIWDLPTRLFHWLLACGFTAAAVIALLLGEHSVFYPYHAIIGLTMTAMVFLRIIWGFVGSRYARFSSFTFGPGAVISYLKGVMLGNGKRHIGHNPGSSLAIFGMMALILGLALTGVLMGLGNKHLKEVHEILAYLMVGVAGIHILGVAVHTIRHRENITAAMIHGSKSAEPDAAIPSTHPEIAIAAFALVGFFAFGMLRGFEPLTRTVRIPVIGTTLQLGEGAEGVREKPHRSGQKHDEDD